MMTVDETTTHRSKGARDALLTRHKGASNAKSPKSDEDVFERYVKAGLPLNVKLEECLPRELAELNELLAAGTADVGPADDPLSHDIMVKEELIDVECTALDPVASVADPLSSLQPITETAAVIKVECELEETKYDTSLCQSDDRALETLQTAAKNRRKCSQRAADRIATYMRSKPHSDSQKRTLKPKTKAILRHRRAMLRRLRRSTESAEEKELQRLRHRITTIKLRLRRQLNCTENELAAQRTRIAEERRLRRWKQKQLETAEETAARKQQQKVQGARRRIHMESIEAPEETLQRKQLNYAQYKARYTKRLSQETAEQQAARKKRVREYYQRYRRLKSANVERCLNFDFAKK